MGKHLRLSLTPLYQGSAPLRVDRKNLRIHGAVAMQNNVEALGHELMTDSQSLITAQELSSTHRGGKGVQGRFGHPSMSENSMGRKVMIARNFRIENDQLIHDIDLLKDNANNPIFTRDPNEWIMDMAENQSADIAESFVMNVDAVWKMPDGRELDANKPFEWHEHEPLDFAYQGKWGERPAAATTPLPVMRPTSLMYLDLVNEGAVTHDGLFNAEMAQAMFMGSSEYGAELYDLIDQWRAEYNIPLSEVPRKVDRVMSVYLMSRGVKMGSAKNLLPQGVFVAGGAPTPDDEDIEDEDGATTEGDAVDEQPQAVTASAPAEQPATSGDPLDAIEQESADMASPAPAPAEQSQPVEASRLAALEGQFAKMEQRLERAERIISNQHHVIKRLQTEVQQPNVTMRVGSTPLSVRNGVQLGARGTPPASVTRQNPRGGAADADQDTRGIGERKLSPRQIEDEAARQVLIAQQQRQQKMSAVGSKKT